MTYMSPLMPRVCPRGSEILSYMSMALSACLLELLPLTTEAPGLILRHP